MKRLVLTIVLVILAILVAGCVMVREHCHGHVRHAVVVSHPRNAAIRPAFGPHPHAYDHTGSRDHPRLKYTHP
jgi:hypothetical protein